jgi:hypothetical protein
MVFLFPPEETENIYELMGARGYWDGTICRKYGGVVCFIKMW